MELTEYIHNERHDHLSYHKKNPWHPHVDLCIFSAPSCSAPSRGNMHRYALLTLLQDKPQRDKARDTNEHTYHTYIPNYKIPSSIQSLKSRSNSNLQEKLPIFT